MNHKNVILLTLALFLAVFLILFNSFSFYKYQKFTRNGSGGESYFLASAFGDFIVDRETKFDDSAEVGDLVSESELIRMLFFGDLMLDRHVGEKISTYGLDYLLEKLKQNDFTDGYDLVGVNLEGAVSNDGEHYPPHNLYDFAFSPDLIEELKKYNFNFFNLANNHLSDQGQKGIGETYQNLSDLGFYYSGCRDAFLSPSDEFAEVIRGEQQVVLSENNCSEIIINIKNKKIAFLGFSLVYKNIDEGKVIEKIKKLKEQSDLVVVNVHFGIEYQTIASPLQVNLARKMVDSGADIIIGHHPHVAQDYEIYQQKPIFYSLGNFIFDQYFSSETQEGLAISLTINEVGGIVSEVYKIKTKGSRIEEILKIP